MNYAVLLYRYLLNPQVQGAPPNYPAEVRPLGAGTTLPVGAGWQLMDDAQLAAAQAAAQTDYNNWTAAAQVVPQDQNHEVDIYNPNSCIASQTWYATKVSTGNYIGIAREILYTYDSTGYSLLTTVENLYDTDGNIYQTNTTNLMSDTSSPSKTVIFEKQNV